MSASCRYYFNALFDHELGGYPTATVARAAAEMATLFIPLLKTNDRAVVDVEMPDGYLARLRMYGLGMGNVSDDGFGTGKPVVWGWSRDALERMAPVPRDVHPPLEVVRKVNGRCFSTLVAKRFGVGVPGARYCATVGKAETAVLDGSVPLPLIVKPAFGASGYGFRLIRSEEQWQGERGDIAKRCENGGVVVEPWLTRKCDMSLSMEIGRDGTVGNLFFQRQWINTHGAYYGSYCADDDPVINPWEKDLARAGREITGEMAKEGYFGPVGIDSFVYETANGDERLAAVVDINARCTMGMLARKIRSLLSIDSPVVLRTIGRKRWRLPETTDEWNAVCGEHAFQTSKKAGILLLTPLRVGYKGMWDQPQRSMFLIAGESEAHIIRLDGELRRRLSQQSSTGKAAYS